MARKKPGIGLKPMGQPQTVEVPKAEENKPELVALTVRMSPEYAKTLKITCYERGVTQNAFMLELIRRELGLA